MAPGAIIILLHAIHFCHVGITGSYSFVRCLLHAIHFCHVGITGSYSFVRCADVSTGSLLCFHTICHNTSREQFLTTGGPLLGGTNILPVMDTDDSAVGSDE